MKRLLILTACAVSCALAARVQADDEDRWAKPLKASLLQALQVRETTTKEGFKAAFSNNEIQVTSPILHVRIDGIRVEPEMGGAYVQNTINDGRVTKSGRGVRGMFAGADNPARRSLNVGEAVQIYRIEIDDDLVRFFVITTKHEQVMIKGNTVTTRFFGAILLPYGENAMPTVQPDKVLADLRGVLGSAQDVAAAETKTIALGQEMDEVRQNLGVPERVIDLRTKVTWVYRDMKVVFVEGKVSDVQ